MMQSLGCVIFSGDESGTKIDEGYLWGILEGLFLHASPRNLAPKHGTMGKVSNLRCRYRLLLKTGIFLCTSEAWWVGHSLRCQGHLCFRTLKLSSCLQKSAMCTSSFLGLLVECSFRDTPEFPPCFCSSQLPITLSKRSYSPIPESPAPSLSYSLQFFFFPQNTIFVFLVFQPTQ